MIPKVLNKEAVLKRLDEYIEEKSIAYAENLVDLRSFEMYKRLNLGREFTEEQEQDYKAIKQIAETKSQKDFEKMMRRFTPEQKKNYTEISKNNQTDEGMTYAQKAMKDLVEFIEVINELKKEVSDS